jgi:hypothetical protein
VVWALDRKDQFKDPLIEMGCGGPLHLVSSPQTLIRSSGQKKFDLDLNKVKFDPTGFSNCFFMKMGINQRNIVLVQVSG